MCSMTQSCRIRTASAPGLVKLKGLASMSSRRCCHQTILQRICLAHPQAGIRQSGATLEVWNAALDGTLDHATTASIKREVPELISSLFGQAIALGHGNRDVATVIEVLQAS
jgi:3-hydroxyisobutyrate dehydrogenase-like beta-hydroxyacid dehydrogenase